MAKSPVTQEERSAAKQLFGEWFPRHGLLRTRNDLLYVALARELREGKKSKEDLIALGNDIKNALDASSPEKVSKAVKAAEATYEFSGIHAALYQLREDLFKLSFDKKIEAAAKTFAKFMPLHELLCTSNGRLYLALHNALVKREVQEAELKKLGDQLQLSLAKGGHEAVLKHVNAVERDVENRVKYALEDLRRRLEPHPADVAEGKKILAPWLVHESFLKLPADHFYAWAGHDIKQQRISKNELEGFREMLTEVVATKGAATVAREIEIVGKYSAAYGYGFRHLYAQLSIPSLCYGKYHASPTERQLYSGHSWDYVRDLKKEFEAMSQTTGAPVEEVREIFLPLYDKAHSIQPYFHYSVNRLVRVLFEKGLVKNLTDLRQAAHVIDQGVDVVDKKLNQVAAQWAKVSGRSPEVEKLNDSFSGSLAFSWKSAVSDGKSFDLLTKENVPATLSKLADRLKEFDRHADAYMNIDRAREFVLRRV